MPHEALLPVNLPDALFEYLTPLGVLLPCTCFLTPGGPTWLAYWIVALDGPVLTVRTELLSSPTSPLPCS